MKNLTLGLALLATACGKPDRSRKEPIVEDLRSLNRGIDLHSGLRTFASCSEAESFVTEHQVNEMKVALLQQIRFHRERAAFEGPVEATRASPSLPEAAPKSDAAPTGHTGTNNQVAGVDEGDVVKNDGRHLFSGNGRRVDVVKMWPAEALAPLMSLRFDGRVQSLLLVTDRRGVAKTLLVASVSDGYDDVSSFVERIPKPPAYDVTTTLTAFDVADPLQPKELYAKTFAGRLTAARARDTRVTLVLSDAVKPPEAVRTWVEEGWKLSSEEFSQKAHELMRENEKVLRSTPLTKRFERRSPKSLEATLDLATCSNLQRPSTDTELGLATLVSLDADTGRHQSQAILANAHEVYMNTKALYITSRHWLWEPTEGSTDATYIHKFDMSSDAPRYKASGALEGHVLNSFSLDEDEHGFLRVAITVTRWKREEGARQWWRLRSETENRVQVLASREGRLQVVGAVTGLAKGEAIQSARFIGNKGYLVTFRQNDPLFTLDLSQPSSPRVVGELKVPGFSSYVHPLDDTHLLAVGVHMNDDGSWWSSTPKVTLFDVSDFAHPRERQSVLVDDLDHASSNVNWDHRAFTFFPQRKLLAIPVSGYQEPCSAHHWWDCSKSQLNLYRVDATSGIAKLGSVNMNDVATERRTDWGSWLEKSFIHRSVLVFGDVSGSTRDFVYAISNNGIRVADVANPTSPVSTSLFPEE